MTWYDPRYGPMGVLSDVCKLMEISSWYLNSHGVMNMKQDWPRSHWQRKWLKFDLVQTK